MGATSTGEILAALNVGRTKEALSPVQGNVQLALAKWGSAIINNLQKNLDKKQGEWNSQINASGNLRQSIRPKIQWFGFNLNYALLLADYYDRVDKGGRSDVKTGDIFDWVNNKPEAQARFNWRIISQIKQVKIAEHITEKIRRYGTKPTNFYSDVVNTTAFNRLRNDLKTALGKDININLKEFKDLVKPK